MAVRECIRRVAMASLCQGFVMAWRVGGARLTRPYTRLMGPVLDRLMGGAR